MRFQKAIKRIIALGTGAIMLGSTVFAASADLANYPMPFVSNGKFSGVLIVGDKAAAEDVIGISDVISSLQFAATTKVSTSGGVSGDVSTTGDTYKIGGSRKLPITEDLVSGAGAQLTINNVSVSSIGGGGNELQALMPGVALNGKGTAPYNQYFYINEGTGGNSGFVKYTENNNAQTADFLYLKSGSELGRYVVEFTTNLQSNINDNTGATSTTGTFLDNFRNVDLKMWGKTYSVVTANRLTTAGSNVDLILMGGAAKDTLTEKQTKTYTVNGKDYEVTLSYVDTTSAQLTVNGQASRKMNKGDTDKLADGTNVGVSEILFQNFAGGIHSATFFIGAQKIELRDTNVADTASSNNLKVDDTSITSDPVIIEGSDDNSTFKISRITVNMTNDDTYYVPAGGLLSQNPDLRKPQSLFTQNWDVQYAGLRTQSMEKDELATSSDNQYNIKFSDGDSHMVSLPIARATGTGSQMTPGDNGKPFINVESYPIAKDSYFIVTDTTQQRGQRKTYALQYKGADKVTADNRVLRFRNLGTGDTIEQSYSPAGSGTALAQLKMGGASYNVYNASVLPANDMNSNDFMIQMDLDNSGGINSGGSGNGTAVTITTKFGAEIGLTNVTNSVASVTTPEMIVTFKTPDSGREAGAIKNMDQGTVTDYAVNVTASSGKVQNTELSGFTAGQGGTKLNLRQPSGTNNIAYGYTAYGTFLTRNTPTNNPATVSFDYPQSQRDAMVFIVGKGATITASSNTNVVSGQPVVLQRIEVGAAKLASEVADVKAQNAILVGGPCANAASAAIMGNPVDCTAGFTPGEGIIQIWDTNGGNVAMLVAGYSAVDTRNAAAVVANYGDYKSSLKGTKVVVKKVNNQLTVAAPAAAVTAPATSNVMADNGSMNSSTH